MRRVLGSAAESRVTIEPDKLEPATKACRAELALEIATQHGFNPSSKTTSSATGRRRSQSALPRTPGRLRATRPSVERLGITGLRCEATGRSPLNSALARESNAAETPDGTVLGQPSLRAEPGVIQ